MATRTISEAGGNWGALTAWVEEAVPTKEDNVVATAKSGSLTINVAAECLSADFTNYVKTLTHNAFGWKIYGSLTLVAGMVYTPASTRAINFESTAAGNKITTAGKTLGQVEFSGSGGEWIFQDKWVTAGFTKLLAGTLNATLISELSMLSFGGASAAAGSVLKMGSATWKMTSTAAGTPFTVATANLTVEGTKAELAISTPSENLRKINLLNRSIGQVTYTQESGVGGLNIEHTGATIGTLTVYNRGAGSGRTLRFTASKTLTLLNPPNISGAAGKLTEILSITEGTKATISLASGVVSCNYLSLKDSKATGGASWYAGDNSTNVSGNEGWLFGHPPGRQSALGVG